MKRALIILLALVIGVSAAMAQRRLFMSSTKRAAAGGGGEPTLGYTTGLVGHWKANALSLSDNDPVGTWTATVGTDGSQSGSKRPTYKSNIYNGWPTVRFDGSDDVMPFTITADSTQTIFVVAKRTLTANATLFALAASAQVYNNASGVWRYFSADTAFSAGNAQALGVAIVKYTGASAAEIRAQSGTWTSLIASAFSSETTLYVGGQDATPATPMDADVCEVLVYDAALSDANVNTVGQYLGTKWGFTWTDL